MGGAVTPSTKPSAMADDTATCVKMPATDEATNHGVHSFAHRLQQTIVPTTTTTKTAINIATNKTMPLITETTLPTVVSVCGASSLPRSYFSDISPQSTFIRSPCVWKAREVGLATKRQNAGQNRSAPKERGVSKSEMAHECKAPTLKLSRERRLADASRLERLVRHHVASSMRRASSSFHSSTMRLGRNTYFSTSSNISGCMHRGEFPASS